MSTAAGSNLTYARVTDEGLAHLERRTPRYWLAVAGCGALAALGGACWAYQISRGLGVSGLNHPVGWATYITTFVFWVGIAHSGTLISAILFLLRASWRTSIYRISEAVTVFSLATAALFPLIHLGRVWVVYYILPYPSGRQLWPNFRSPLVWDVLAISTYLTVSVIFFGIGLMPDIAAARDRLTHGVRKKVYSLLALGWTGSGRQWRNYGAGYVFFAGLATPLVISVHSVVSWDFAMSIVPGWHTTIFAPYFVAGAIFSGLAIVLAILIPLRRIFRIEQLITVDNLESTAKMMLFTSLIVGYAYLVEVFIAWYSGNQYETAIYFYRPTGNYAAIYWIMVTCNVVIPLALFVKRVRRNMKVLWLISLAVIVGMWFERFNIIVSSLAHEYLPFSWGLYAPRPVELAILLGSFGWFFFLILLFAKNLPAVAVTEIKEALPPPRLQPREGER